jgi:N-acetylmuramoyl-L-alanine amidase
VPSELRRGSSGEAIRDLQTRLAALGHGIGHDEPGELGPGTEAAVRAFQEARGLRVDGVVGRETWSTIVESGYALGDRLLYLRRPMFRGDDVADLQRRLNALGFDAGREDGILGEETHRGLVEFQRAMGGPADGICGSTTIAALARVGGFADGSVATLREREQLRAEPGRLAERKIYVAATPGLAALGDLVTRGLLEAGAHAVLDASGADDSFVSEAANRYGADLFLALRTGDGEGCRCVYFSAGRYRSEPGFAIATAIQDALGSVLPVSIEVSGMAYSPLRETRMPAVVCELAPEGDVEAMRALVASAGPTSRAIVRGIQTGVEQPTVEE